MEDETDEPSPPAAKPPPPVPAKPAAGHGADREARLAAALRANLRRRKAPRRADPS
ncbi:MAG: hypothetical protein JO127_10615 [Caulobacteraceae bacterium]|nr:hypothetical protein [Caulobacteraceae bacterium]